MSKTTDAVNELADLLARECPLRELMVAIPPVRDFVSETKRSERVWTRDEMKDAVEYNKRVDPREPRRLLPGMHPIFRDHNCPRCKSGERACVHGDPGRCGWPRARND